MNKILLIEPSGGYIRLDRCIQSINSWGGVYRYPLNLARIGAYLLSLGKEVIFIDLQADSNANLEKTLIDFKPDLCILSCGFPSMKIDSLTAKQIKQILPKTKVATFGVAPTLLKESFFSNDTWGFTIYFDAIVTGGEPAFGFEKLVSKPNIPNTSIFQGSMKGAKSINSQVSRHLFDHSLYNSPFTGQRATYVEGTYGCPYRCNFCVVPVLYNGRFSKRTPEDIVNEFRYAILENGVSQITLWDEGTTFQKSFITELCDRLIDLRMSSSDQRLKKFIWTTRSTTSLLDEKVVKKMALSGLSGVTLGLESFDEKVLKGVEKRNTIEDNFRAIELLKKNNIISIGHFILGQINDTHESIKKTIKAAINSDLNYAQFYCAVPYPSTKLHSIAKSFDLIRVNDLTQYELSNPIMDTLGGVLHNEVGRYRAEAIEKFWTTKRWSELNKLISKSNKDIIPTINQNKILKWNVESKNDKQVEKSDSYSYLTSY